MNRHLSPATRRLILGGAFLAATLCAYLPDSATVHASQTSAAVGLKPDPQFGLQPDLPADSPPELLVLAQADPKSAADSARDVAREAREVAREARDAAREAAAAARAEAREATRRAIDAELDNDEKAGRDKGIRLDLKGLKGLDRQYDSFDQFVDNDPALATIAFGMVFIVFLTPVLIIALLVWYKIRKSRMLNETMLKLAERGIVPPGEALEAIQSGRVANALESSPGATPLLAQAKALRTRAAWSDLRKGVLLGAIGFAWTVWSLSTDDFSPNWLGLILLFVGIGYGALAYLENRQAQGLGSTPPAGPGDVKN